jgi:hypothetical protein
MPKHATSTSFQPGQSGNPAGKRSATDAEREARELAKKHCPEAIMVLVNLMRHGRQEVARANAANSLLDRGIGKPAQQTILTGANDGPVQIEHQQAQNEAELVRILSALDPNHESVIDGADETKH